MKGRGRPASGRRPTSCSGARRPTSPAGPAPAGPAPSPGPERLTSSERSRLASCRGLLLLLLVLPNSSCLEPLHRRPLRRTNDGLLLFLGGRRAARNPQLQQPDVGYLFGVRKAETGPRQHRESPVLERLGAEHPLAERLRQLPCG